MEAGSHTQSPDRSEFNGLAIAATNHCLTGCAIGEVAGMGLAMTFGWGNVAQTSLAIVLVTLIPSALGAGLGDPLFYGSIAAGFAVAYPFAFWANRWQIARGRGHALMHEQHAH